MDEMDNFPDLDELDGDDEVDDEEEEESSSRPSAASDGRKRHNKGYGKGKDAENKKYERDDPKDKPEPYDGKDREKYPTWRKKTDLWRADTRCPPHKRGIRIMRSLTDNAWEVVEDCDLASVKKENGDDFLLSLLDPAYEYNATEDMQKRFDDVIYAANKGLEDMTPFLNNLFAKIRKLEVKMKNQPCPHCTRPVRGCIQDELKGYIIVKRAAWTPPLDNSCRR